MCKLTLSYYHPRPALLRNPHLSVDNGVKIYQVRLERVKDKKQLDSDCWIFNMELEL